MEDQDQEEVVVKAVKELKKSPTKSMKSSEWSMENGLLYYRGKIYVPGSDLHCKISPSAMIPNSQDTPVDGKLLSQGTMYWWPQMSRYIGKYICLYL